MSASDAIRAREEAKRPKLPPVKEVKRGRKAIEGDTEGPAPVGEPVTEAEAEAVDESGE